MSDLTTQDQPQESQPQKTEETQQPNTEKANETPTVSNKKKSLMAKLNFFGGQSLVWQYGIFAVVCLVGLGGICFLFMLQWKYVKGGNKEIGRLVEEKVMDAITKSLNFEVKQSGTGKQEKDSKSVGFKNAQTAINVDKTKYIIEANRLYEKGDYESAATCYGKGMDKSMPFLNEDFVLYRLGDCYLKTGRYEDALKEFRALNNDYIDTPYQIRSLLKTGECYAGLGEFKKARKTLYTVVAQEGKCNCDDDKSAVVDAYFKIAEYYMEEAERLRNATTVGTSSVANR